MLVTLLRNFCEQACDENNEKLTELQHLCQRICNGLKCGDIQFLTSLHSVFYSTSRGALYPAFATI